MRWNPKSKPKLDLSQWHTWFAWKPVVLWDYRTKVWLEIILRKRICTVHEGIPIWQYRTYEKDFN